MYFRVLYLCVLSLLYVPSFGHAEDLSSYPQYQPTAVLSGSLHSTGSDTLNALMTQLATQFAQLHPQVTLQVQGSGSSTAPTALIQGTASLAPMSRPMRLSERHEFEQQYGYPPLELPIALDLIAVFVNRDNPLTRISLVELDALYSVTQYQSAGMSIQRWGDLGLEGRLHDQPIALFGRNAASGTYGFFRDLVLLGGDFRPQVSEQPGSAAVVRSISRSFNGLGYSGLGAASVDVKPLAISIRPTDAAILPTAQNALEQRYPLARFLYLYLNHPPSKPLSPLHAEFIRMLYSTTGQSILMQEGFVALPADEAINILRSLDLDAS